MLTDLSRIKHLVVLMLENRSFDHALGSLALEGWDVDGVVLQPPRSNTDLAGNRHFVGPLGLPRASAFVPGPPHSPDFVIEQCDRMAGFVRAYQRACPDVDDLSPGDVMLYLDRTHLPMTYFLADHYTVCDHWFAAVPTDTIPNRLYSIAGDAGPVRTTAPRLSMLDIPALQSVFERMNDPSDWLIFTGSIPLSFVVSPLRVLACNRERWHTLSRFRDVVRAHELPKVTWIEPTYFWVDAACHLLRHVHVDPFFKDTNDDHPPSHTEHGQALIRYVYESLASVPEVWESTVLVVCYDEHGGFYDHVPPPALAEEDIGEDGFRHRGLRVPAMIASPFAREKHTCSAQLDHCSILKFICEWLDLRPWTPRIRATDIASIAAALDDTARTDRPMPDYTTVLPSQAPGKRHKHHGSKTPHLVRDLHRITYQEHRDAYERVFPHAHAPVATRMKWWFR